MVQLPPKVHPITVCIDSTAMENHPPSWVREFFDFTCMRRGTHRRSVSDSVTFFEPAMAMPEMVSTTIDEGQADNNSPCLDSENLALDKFDEDQLMSMLAEDMALSLPPTSSNPSTPSDQNSNNDSKPPAIMLLDQQYQLQQENLLGKMDPGEVESSCKQQAIQHLQPSSSTGNLVVSDPKRVKRILANRQSAQRSRVRKLQYISDLERSVTTLQTEVSALSPRVAYLDHQRLILNVDNSALKQRIAALAQDKIFKDAHQKALKKEIERLRQVYHQQNMKKMNHIELNNNQPQQPQHQTEL